MSFDGVDWGGDERALHGDIRLDGKDIDLVVGGALQGFDEELALDGSPIVRLTLIDPDCQLERSGILDLDADDEDVLRREVELIVDGVAYWLRQATRSTTGDTVELTFEDRTVCLLRDVTGSMKVSPRTLDVRGFVTRLCVKAGTPELISAESAGEDEARAGARLGTTTKLGQKRRQDDRDRRRKPGLRTISGLTVKGSSATPQQHQTAARLLAVADDLKAPPLAMVSMIFAAIGESTLGADMGFNGLGYGGVLGGHQRWFGQDDVEEMARCFMLSGNGFHDGAIKLARTIANPEEIAVRVERPSIWPDNAYARQTGYDRFLPEAKQWVTEFTGGDLQLSSGVPVTTTKRTESALTVDRDESFWDAARRTAEDYQARFFVVSNQPYFLFDDALMRARPALTIANPRHPRADPDLAEGVDGIGWEWAPRRQLRKTDLVINATIRQIQPGDVVMLDETCGPAGIDPAGGRDGQRRGRWLVGQYNRSRFDVRANVTLIKGRKPRIPVDVESRTSTPAGALGGGAVRGAGARVSGTPKEIIDTIVLPLAQAAGINRSVAENDAGNASHGPTVSGTRSDHQGPPDRAWAADMSNGTSPTPEMDRLAGDLCARFRIPPLDLTVVSSDANAHSVSWGGYRFQIIYRSGVGGNHTNHVHFGVQVA